MSKPIEILNKDDLENTINKLQILFDDIYRKFSALNDVYDFVSGEPVPQQSIVSVDSDEVNLDLTQHLINYNHNNIHVRQHALDSTLDHTSTITEDNIFTGDANGLPKDSGSSISDVEDCDNHTSGSTNFVLAQQAAEADLDQTISDPPTQAEVQAISDKVDALLAKLRSANVLAT